jgi:hypothetical protein
MWSACTVAGKTTKARSAAHAAPRCLAVVLIANPPCPTFSVFVRLSAIAARCQAITSSGPELRWEYGVSEQPLADRFLRQRQLPVICHPIEGGLAVTAERSKIGGILRRLAKPMRKWDPPLQSVVGGVDPAVYDYSHSALPAEMLTPHPGRCCLACRGRCSLGAAGVLRTPATCPGSEPGSGPPGRRESARRSRG